MHTNQPLAQTIDFGNEAGDDVDDHELLSYFVAHRKFEPFFDSKHRIKVATAKKGVGKSALLKYISIKAREADPENLVIFCKGRDLVRTNFPLPYKISTPNEYISDWINRINHIIVRALGRHLDLAFTDDSIALIEAAELSGLRGRSLVTAILDRLPKLVPQAGRVLKEHQNPEELVKRVANKKVWFIVDDLDATYQRTSAEDLELSTFFSALRAIVSSMTGIVFRVSMRTDVWSLIRKFDESLDKVDQYVQEIAWVQADFRKFLARRIEQHMLARHFHITRKPDHASDEEADEYFINQVFEKRMAWGDQEKRTYKILYVLSYLRPRWAIQLCKAAQDKVIQQKDPIITRTHIGSIWTEYGKKRITDLVAEHKHQCSSIQELLSGFRGAPRRLSRDELITWIRNHITNHITPVIEGVQVKNPIEVGHFLYRIGFIVARAEENDLYEHYYFADMPDFLSSRTNKDFGMIWEIHPCYREALDIQKLNEWKRANRPNR